MTKWQPIETAPSDKRVKVGRYSYYGDEAKWRVDTGIPFKTVYVFLEGKE